jgi:hypothetical protein
MAHKVFTMSFGEVPVRLEGGKPVFDGSTPQKGDIIYDPNGQVLQQQEGVQAQIGGGKPFEYHHAVRARPWAIFA